MRANVCVLCVCANVCVLCVCCMYERVCCVCCVCVNLCTVCMNVCVCAVQVRGVRVMPVDNYPSVIAVAV